MADTVLEMAGARTSRAVDAAARAAVRVVEVLSGVPLVTTVPTNEPLVGLSFDDGPDPSTTSGVLDVLARHRCHATFMLIGERAERHPALVEAVAQGGHELGNHLMRDEPTICLGRDAFRQQVAAVDRLLAPHGAVRFYRPGSGWFTLGMLRDGAALGHRCALGSPLLVRQRYPDPERVGRRLAALCHPGAVVVLHEGTTDRAGVAETADVFISALQRRGLHPVCLAALEDSTSE